MHSREMDAGVIFISPRSQAKMKPWRTPHHSTSCEVVLCREELDSMNLVGPFQLRAFFEFISL